MLEQLLGHSSNGHAGAVREVLARYSAADRSRETVESMLEKARESLRNLHDTGPLLALTRFLGNQVTRLSAT